MKFSRGKVLYLGRNNPTHQYMLGADWLESSPAEKDLGVLADAKLTVSSNMILWQRLMVYWAALGGVLLAG